MGVALLLAIILVLVLLLNSPGHGLRMLACVDLALTDRIALRLHFAIAMEAVEQIILAMHKSESVSLSE